MCLPASAGDVSKPPSKKDRKDLSTPSNVAGSSANWKVLPLLLLLILVLAGSFSPQVAVSSQDPGNGTEAWDNVTLPSIAVLIVAGYGLALLAVLYLPTWLGPEASSWAILAALVLVMTRRWWSTPVFDFVQQHLPLNFWVTVVAVCCLLYAAVGVLEDTEQSQDMDKVQCKRFLEEETKAIFKAVQNDPGNRSPTNAVGESEGTPVLLHIYDVSHNATIQKLNWLLANRFSPVKFGGIFHTGIEVYGREWCFGCCYEGTGVTGIMPRRNPQHHYRESIRLPSTHLSQEQVACAIKRLAAQYQGADYCLLRKNCCHFADDLCQCLGVAGLPFWVHRLGRVAMQLSDGLSQIYFLFANRMGLLNQCARIAQL